MVISRDIFRIAIPWEAPADILQSVDSQWEKFLLPESENPPIALSVTLRKITQNAYSLDLFPPQPGPMVLKSKDVLLSANADWSEACLTLSGDSRDGLEGALIAAIATRLAFQGGLMLHASFIAYRGHGIFFVGPSGIGKTTQAELWARYRNATIINGDMALVLAEKDRFVGYGCPWHGSSVYCENLCAPLAGIVVLEQAETNTLERLSGVWMIERAMGNIFLPHWCEAGAQAAMSTINQLLTDVPVYLLRCRPGEEAVEMVERALFISDDFEN